MNVRAPGIAVTIVGERDQAKRVLLVVKEELERNHRRRVIERARSTSRMPSSVRIVEPVLATDSQVVRPTDLDEMDSPYAIPEHRTMPPTEGATPEDATGEDLGETSTHDIRDTLAASEFDEEGPEREVTAVDVNLSPPVPQQRVEVKKLFPEDERATVPPTTADLPLVRGTTEDVVLTPRAPSRARDGSDPHRG